MGVACSNKEDKRLSALSAASGTPAFEVVTDEPTHVVLEMADLEDELESRPISINKAFAARNARGLLVTSDPNKKLVTDEINHCHEHGLLQACRLAYTYHTPLCLSPDHFWTLIMQGVASFIFIDSDNLPEIFEDFDRSLKLEMVIDMDEMDESDPADWMESLTDVVDTITESLGKASPILKASFSTTQDSHELLFMMNLMHKPKWTQCVRPECESEGGLSQVKLIGTVEDWEDLRSMCLKLKSCGLGWWIDELEVILDNLVSSRKAESDTHSNFWQSMYKKQDSSGHVYGWILNFFPFEKGRKREEFFDIDHLPHAKSDSESIDCECEEESCTCKNNDSDESSVCSLQSVPIGLTRADLTCDLDDTLIPYMFHGGFLGSEIGDDGFVTPTLSWGVGLKNGTKNKKQTAPPPLKKSKSKNAKNQLKKGKSRRGKSIVAKPKKKENSRSRKKDKYIDNSESEDSTQVVQSSTKRKKRKRKKDKSDGSDSESDSTVLSSCTSSQIKQSKLRKKTARRRVADDISESSVSGRSRKAKVKNRKTKNRKAKSKSAERRSHESSDDEISSSSSSSSSHERLKPKKKGRRGKQQRKKGKKSRSKSSEKKSRSRAKKMKCYE